MYRIKEAADIAKVSVRTLHHYDRIGLLTPRKAGNGYRYYDDADMDALQSILYFKYLGFPLDDIRRLLVAAESDRLGMLERQMSLLNDERRRLDALVDTLKKTIENERGGTLMTTDEKFSGFAWEEGRKYEAAARRLYGDDAIDESLRRQEGKEGEAAEAFNDVFRALAKNHADGLSVGAEENLALARELLSCIRVYGFDCSTEVFGHIGAGYSANPEFRKNIDRFGEGTASYVSAVVKAFVEVQA